jgi:hypothetical protein
VILEVMAGAIGDADALDPTVLAMDFTIPAIGGVVSHLGAGVLAEADSRRVYADADEEIPGPREEPSHCRVTDDSGF